MGHLLPTKIGVAQKEKTPMRAKGGTPEAGRWTMTTMTTTKKKRKTSMSLKRSSIPYSRSFRKSLRLRRKSARTSWNAIGRVGC